MKQKMLIILVLILSSITLYAKEFYITSGFYKYTDDWEDAVYLEFGKNYRVADWNDIKEYYNNGGDILALLDKLGLREYESSVFVTKSGKQYYSSNRAYFLSRHEHRLPSYYLAHDNIDNYLVSLGSWHSMKKKIMVVRKQDNLEGNNNYSGKTSGVISTYKESTYNGILIGDTRIDGKPAIDIEVRVYNDNMTELLGYTESHIASNNFSSEYKVMNLPLNEKLKVMAWYPLPNQLVGYNIIISSNKPEYRLPITLDLQNTTMAGDPSIESTGMGALLSLWIDITEMIKKIIENKIKPVDVLILWPFKQGYEGWEVNGYGRLENGKMALYGNKDTKSNMEHKLPATFLYRPFIVKGEYKIIMDDVIGAINNANGKINLNIYAGYGENKKLLKTYNIYPNNGGKLSVYNYIDFEVYVNENDKSLWNWSDYHYLTLSIEVEGISKVLFDNIHIIKVQQKEKHNNNLKYIGENEKGYKEYENRKDGSIMIYIPAGEFIMGSNDSVYDDGGNNISYDENPSHKVYLDEYYISKYEITNKQYKKFCDETGHHYPPDPNFSGMSNYFINYPNYPVVNVSWIDAVAYCKWAGLRLPTEAEWEKAARGTDGRKYPWDGNNYDDKHYVNCTFYTYAPGADGYEYTSPVGKYPKGQSPYGVMDAVGNVYELCSDWYSDNYYSKSPYRNPKGPKLGIKKVCRGGSWGTYFFGGCINTTCRAKIKIFSHDNITGFRPAY